jgi:hypothetical protein
MSRTVFKLVSPAPAFDRLPIRIELAPAGSAFSRAALVLPAVLAIVVLVSGVASAAAPSVLDALVRRPLATMQVAAGLTLWAALFVLPATRAVTALWRRRVVSIAHGIVEIDDRLVTRMRTRRAALSEYRGVAHHIRTSLSGLTHEIALVHANPALTVTLVSADRITQGTLDAIKSLLRLPEIPPRALFERGDARSAREASGVLAPAQA